jgi:acyl-CoA synthetase (AMP-forming)/AMP-acid ligase II
MYLHSFLDYWAREQPEAEFAVQNDQQITYHQALVAVNRLANALVSIGLQVGDRLALLAKNRVEYVHLYFAASKAGVGRTHPTCGRSLAAVELLPTSRD